MNDTTTLDSLFERWLDGFKSQRQPSLADLCKDRPELLAALHERINSHLRSTDSLPPETRTSNAAIDTPARSGIGGLLALMPPCDFGPYRIEKQLGAGGMGAVYLARETHLNRDVALKVMLPRVAASGEARDRFLNEARAMAALEHDHVVPVFRADEINGIPFLAMPRLRGESLETRLKREKTLPAAEVIRIGSEMARGLAAAHARGLIHRDVKPANTWMEAGTGRVKILDFGIAAATVPGSPGEGGIIGSPPYMSPEQTRGEPLDERSDIYSLGVTLYEMAAGKRPSDRATVVATMQAIANEQPRPPHELHPDIPASLSSLIMRLLEKDPARRPTSAAAVVEELRQLQNTLTVSPIPKQVANNRLRWRLVTAVVFLLGVAVFVPLYYAKPPSGSKQNGPDLSEPHPLFVEPFRVKSLDIKHFVKTPEGDLPKGVLGRDSFSPLLGDRVQVIAKLSRPAYAYLIAFRPDGEAELCFPDSEDIAPPLTDTPRYPKADSTKAYGLREGTGLWAFGVVASAKPLPTYKQWLSEHKPNWKQVPSPTGSVWWYDGAEMETLMDAGVGGKRAKDEDLTGPADTVRSLGKWLEQTTDTKIGVVGFGVGRRN